MLDTARPPRRHLRVVWSLSIRAEDKPLPPLVRVETRELEKMQGRLKSFLSYGEESDSIRNPLIAQLRQEVEQILRDYRFRGYDWFSLPHKVLLSKDVSDRGRRALYTIEGVLKTR